MSSSRATSVGKITGTLAHVWESILLRVAILGLLLIVLGWLVIDGVFAGMFGIWGASALFVGLSGFAIYKLIYEP